MVDFWLGTFPVPGRIAEIATMAERDGWDGLAFTDSQANLAPLRLGAYVAARLTELVSLGLDHVVIVGHSRNTPPDVFAESSRRFCAEVMPLVRR